MPCLMIFIAMKPTQSLDGRHNGWRFGMHVRVKVIEVTPVSGVILVEWVEGAPGRHLQKRKKQNAQKNFGKQ